MNEPIWLNAAAAAEALGVHVTTVRRRGHAGTIETRVGEDGVTLYRVEATDSEPEPAPAPAQWRYNHQYQEWRYEDPDGSRRVVGYPVTFSWFASYSDTHGCRSVVRCYPGTALEALRDDATGTSSIHAFISAALDAVPEVFITPDPEPAPEPEPEPEPEPTWANPSTDYWQYEDGGNIVDVWSTTTGVVARYHGSDGLDRRFGAVYAETAIEHLINWLGDHGHDTIVPAALACLPDELRAPTEPPEVTWRYDVSSRLWQAQGDGQSLRVRRNRGSISTWIVEHRGPDSSTWSHPDPARALKFAEMWAENHREHAAFISAARACAPRAFEIPEVTWQPGWRRGYVWAVADDLRVGVRRATWQPGWRATITRPPTQRPRGALRPTAQAALRALAEDTTDAYDRAVLEAALSDVGNSGVWQTGVPPFETADWHQPEPDWHGSEYDVPRRRLDLPRSQHHRTAARPDAPDPLRAQSHVHVTLGRRRDEPTESVEADPPPSPPVNHYGSRLTVCDFAGEDLRYADFSLAHLDRCDFTGARLVGAHFASASFDRCRGLRYASVSVPWHGEIGRSLVAVDHGSEGVIYHCGCFRGDWDALVEWIESHDEDLAGSRIRVAHAVRDLIEEDE